MHAAKQFPVPETNTPGGMNNDGPPTAPRPNQVPQWLLLVGAGVGGHVLLRAPGLLLGTLPSAPTAETLWYYWEGPLRLFSLDLFALASLLALIPVSAAAGRYTRHFAVGSLFVLLAYETYDALITFFLHRSPIAYADVSHVVGALHLSWNAVSPVLYGAGLLGIVGTVDLLARTLPPTVEHLHRVLREPAVRRKLFALNLLVWPLVGFAAGTDRGIERQTYQAVCLSTTECIVHNVRASVRLQERTVPRTTAMVDSSYVEYESLEWTDPPSIYVVMIESYGRTLATSTDTRAPYDHLMGNLGDSLRAAGWHAATAQSRAPVFGGLSWLSAATVLLGRPVDYQPVFERLRRRLSRYPHLVGLLRRQGYTTATLQPPVRDRAGLSVRNPYAFDYTLYFEDLDYRGPTHGWGIVPDQYSLSVAHREVVESARRPFFLFFETVTSHAPWDRPPPPLVDDAAALNRSPPPASAQRAPSRTGPAPPSPDESALSKNERLFRHVRYDWQVLTRYLRTKAPANSLVVVLGDHQPYVAESSSLATPLHVLSRDERLVRRFDEYGLVPGLRPSPSADTLHHAGLYSMLVRTLTAHDRARGGSSTAPLPAYQPQGVTRSALLPNQP